MVGLVILILGEENFVRLLFVLNIAGQGNACYFLSLQMDPLTLYFVYTNISAAYNYSQEAGFIFGWEYGRS